MMVVCNGQVCEMYTTKKGETVYRSYATGKIIKREKLTKAQREALETKWEAIRNSES